MLHILIPYDPKSAVPAGSACRTCGKHHPHSHEMIVIDAIPFGPPMMVPQEMDPWGHGPNLPPPSGRRRLGG